MGTFSFLGLLAIMTLGAGVIFALWSKERTERRMRDETAPKSTLASDAPDQH